MLDISWPWWSLTDSENGVGSLYSTEFRSAFRISEVHVPATKLVFRPTATNGIRPLRMYKMRPDNENHFGAR